jgi:DHA2 family methylenomycin A resistance protein-like MFS transporter
MATPEVAGSSGGGSLTSSGWKVAILVLGIASLVTSVDLTIISVALPTIEDSLSLSPSEGQWVVNAYLLSFTLLLIPGGMFGDRIGQLKGMNLGLVVFAIGSVMCGLAPGSEVMIAGRVVQGIGAAVLMPCLQALVTRIAPSDKTGVAFGVYIAVSSVGMAIGPLVGGAIVDLVAWEWIFLVNPIIIVPLLFIGHVFLRNAGEGVDRNKKRLITWEMLRRPSLRSGLFLIFWIRLPLIWVFIYAGIYFQTVLGYDAFQAGLAMLPGVVGIGIGGVISGRLKDKVGWKLPTVIGYLMVAGCLVVIAYALTLESYPLIVIPMFLLGIALNLATTPVNVLAITDADPVERGMISGTMTVAAQAGNTVGSLILGGITNALVLGSLTAEYAKSEAEKIFDQIQHPVSASDLPASELATGLQVFSDSMAEAALIGAGIVVLALLAAWVLRMFRDPGPGANSGFDVEELGEDESLAQT